nr:nucleoredoxin isoform X4 [Pan troglodytes]
MPILCPSPEPSNGERVPSPEPSNGKRAPSPEVSNGKRAPSPEVSNGKRAPSPEVSNGKRAPSPEVSNGRRVPSPEPSNGNCAPSPEPSNGRRVPSPEPSNANCAPSPEPTVTVPLHRNRATLKLWNKYRISNIPSLIFLDATTGKVVCRNGLLVIRDDPEGLEFPWGPKPFREVIAGPLLRNNGQSLESSSLEGSHVGVYFSAHWCPPCRSLTRVLVESYRKIKEAGQNFEIIFVSADRSEESFKQYFSEMPWLAVPYTDEARRSRLNRLYGIQDSEDDGESEAAKQLIQPIAEKIIAKYKAKEEEAPLLFFVAGEDDMTDSLRDYTNLPEAAPLLTILDMSARAKYVMDVEEITPAIVEAFVNDFLAEKLKPEPI